MLVVVITMGRMTMTVVDIVNVIAVRNCYVATARAVDVIAVVFGHFVLSALALDPLAIELAVDVAVMYVVDVIFVLEGNVAAALAVDVGVVFMNRCAHGGSSLSEEMMGN